MQQDVKLSEILRPSIESLGYELVGVEIVTAAARIVKVYIDKPGGVSLDDCAKVSRQVGALLDVEDYIKSEYTLEVSSPGINRIVFKAEQLLDHVGKVLKVKLFKPIESRRNLVGKIIKVEEDLVTMELLDDTARVTFDFTDVNRANLVHSLVK